MGKHIIDYLNNIDETLLEDALCIPEQSYEVVLDASKHYTRGSMLRTAALAASLAAAVTIVVTGAMYNNGFSANGSGISSEVSGSVSGGILIPTEFSQADLEAQRIVQEKYLSAKKVVADCFICQSYDNPSIHDFVFPQINEPLSSQPRRYFYFYRDNVPKETAQESFSQAFTHEATELYMKQYGVGRMMHYPPNEIKLDSGGIYDKNGYLIEPPAVIQFDETYYMRADSKMKEFMAGAYIGTIREVSRTDDELIFSYIRSDPSGWTLMEERGRMVLQNGSWLFSWYEGWIF